uniref:Uncharacterized protein n=1 Tax=Arundo donax TaxID=35708 RepID=A0A0A9FWQ2_ARUDO
MRPTSTGWAGCGLDLGF